MFFTAQSAHRLISYLSAIVTKINAISAKNATEEVEMPGFDGTGPRGSGRPGRGLGCRNRFGQGQAGKNSLPKQGYVYEYTLEELKERKQALEEEIRWIDDRIGELEKES
jgi:hypothetical protein